MFPPKTFLFLLLLNVEVAWSVIYNVSYDITGTSVEPNLTITWFPPEAWYPDNNGDNTGGSARATEAQGATMNFTFTGSAVYLIGVKAPSSSLFSVSVDNAPPQYRNISSGNPNAYIFQQMLYSQEGLDPTAQHTFLTNQSSAAGSQLSVDQILITRDSDFTPSSTSSQPTASSSASSNSTSSQTKKGPSGAVIGGVVAAVVAALAIIIAGLLWLRLRKARSFEEYAPAAVRRASRPIDIWEPPANPVGSYPATAGYGPEFASIPPTSNAMSTTFTSPEPGPSVVASPWPEHEFRQGPVPAGAEKRTGAPPPYNA